MKTISRTKKFVFAAVTVVGFLSICESVLWLCGVQSRMEREDPYLGFSRQVKVFERDGDLFRTTRTKRHNTFNDQTFLAEKPENGLRIFCLGGSSAFGFPWGAEVAFTSILGDVLAAHHPERHVEAINVGGMSYAMHRLRIVANEIMDHDPDILLIYSGHNEFVETAFFDELKKRSEFRQGYDRLLNHSRIYSWMHATYSEYSRGERPLIERFEAYVQRDVSSVYSRQQKDKIIAEFRRNLEHILDLAASRGVRVVLSTVPCNLSEWKPAQSTVEADLDDAQKNRRADALGRGIQELEQGHFENAIAQLEQAVALAPRHAESHFGLGQAYAAAEQWTEAQKSFQLACDTDAAPIRRLSAANQVIRELGQRSDGNDVLLVDDMLLVDIDQQFERLSPHGLVGFNLIEDYVHPTQEGHQWIAWHMCQSIEDSGWLGSEPRKSREVFDQVVAVRPEPTESNEASWLFNQGCVLAHQGQTELALEKYRQAIDKRPDYAAALFNLGLLLSRTEKHEEAVARLQQALTLDPENPDVHGALGTAYRQSGQPQTALDHFHTALAARPSDGNMRNNLANTLVRLNRFDEAIDEYRRATKIQPTHAGIRINLGNTLMAEKRFEEAAEEFRTATQLAPTVPAAHTGLGNSLLKLGDAVQAEQHLRRALSIRPQHYPAHLGLGHALLGQKKPAEAGQSFSQALKLNPRGDAALVGLGIAYFQNADPQQARQCFQEAIRRDPNSRQARMWLQKLDGIDE